MALKAATFTGFETCELSLVQVSDRELGHGSYATVLELEYMGLKCAGKKIHELLLKQGDISYAIFRFEEECRLLSQIRHPNIVQFLGVYFQEGVQVPILVMEFLSTNLTSCIEQYSILPKEISYSILHDVALGLCYLHSQMPPIIHRDLSSNNVLLTPNMTAKISDLGVARILELTSLQASHMTQTPGTPAYMPPEVMIANPKYDTSVDEFSYGIMMIHVLSGRWPEPQVGPVHTEFQTGKMIPVSEAERRNVFLQDIGKDHLLMNLILKCIDNCPQARAGALELVEQLADAVSRFPLSFANKVEMLRRIERDEAEKRSLIYEGERKNRAISEAEDQITIYREEIRAKEKQKAVGISQVRAAYSTELEQLHLHVEDLRVQLQMLKAEKEAEVAELKSQIEICEAELDNKDNSLLLEQKRIIEERKLNQQLVGENHELKLEITNLKTMIHSLQHTSGLNEAIIARKESQLQARISALQEKDSILSTMTTLLTRARECLAAQQVSIVLTQSCCLYCGSCNIINFDY